MGRARPLGTKRRPHPPQQPLQHVNGIPLACAEARQRGESELRLDKRQGGGIPSRAGRIDSGATSVVQPVPRSSNPEGGFTLIWLLVLLIVLLAVAGGLALSKFLFILLVVAVIVALFGARSSV